MVEAASKEMNGYTGEGETNCGDWKTNLGTRKWHQSERHCGAFSTGRVLGRAVPAKR